MAVDKDLERELIDSQIFLKSGEYGRISKVIAILAEVDTESGAVRILPRTPFDAVVDATVSGDTEVFDPGAGKIFYITDIHLSNYGVVDVVVKFKSGTSDITGSMKFIPAGGMVSNLKSPLIGKAAAEKLKINLDVNAQVGGFVTGYLVEVPP